MWEKYIIWNKPTSTITIVSVTDDIKWLTLCSAIKQGDLNIPKGISIDDKILLALKVNKIEQVCVDVPEKLSLSRSERVITRIKSYLPTILVTNNFYEQFETFCEEYKKVVKNIRLPISILKVMPFVISRIENNYPQYISLLTSLSKDHDRFTHSIQVMFLSLQLGIEYWITGEQLFDLWISWLFHDIWFTFIPSSYVWLSGVLTLNHRIVINLHSILWYILLSNDQTQINLPALVAGTHHESSFQSYWIDSSFKSILHSPLIVKKDLKDYIEIISIADKYAALSSKRPHREPYTISEAYSIIEQENENSEYLAYLKKVIKI